MIIRMAKVEIVGPKQDLIDTLELLHNRGIFQPDPQLVERVELAEEDRLQALVLDKNELREQNFFQNLLERINALLELLPEVTDSISPIQPLPVMDLLDELVDQHLDNTRDLTSAYSQCRKEADRISFPVGNSF